MSAHCSRDDLARRRIGAVRRWLFVGVLAALASGCALFNMAGQDETAGWSADRLYNEARDNLRQGNFTRAAKLYEALESRYPYGRYAQQAALETAYANYRTADKATAVAACERFIRTYPNHPNVDYAYYLKGLSSFRDDQGLLGYLYDLDPSEREPKALRDAFDTFKELVTKFPTSKYAEDAEARMRYLNNALALHEVKVGRYYYNRGAYIAAVSRAQLAITEHPRTPANEDALDLLVKSYDKLGLTQLRDDTAKILRNSFPNSVYVTGADARPWWRFW